MNAYWHETTPVTDQFGTGLAHQVFDAHATHQHQHQGGRMRTVCGQYITPAPMISTVGEPCTVCVMILNERSHEHRTQRPVNRTGLRFRSRFWGRTPRLPGA